MDLKAPCLDPEFRGQGQGPGNVPNFLLLLVTRKRGFLPLHWGVSQALLLAVTYLMEKSSALPSIKGKGTAVHMQMPHHPLRGGQAPLGQRLVSCPIAAAVGWVDTHRAQTCPVATQGCSTGKKKVGVKTAGYEGGKGGSVFTGVYGGRGCQAAAWFQVCVHLCCLFFGKGANVVYRTPPKEKLWSLAMVL